MTMTLERRWVLVAAVLIGGLVVAKPSSGKDQKVDTWNARIQETVGLLRRGDATQAHAVISPVLEEMTQEVNPGKKSEHAIALALMLRALAEAGGGDERNATWDWHVAQQLDPAIESWDFREFGGAGEVLARHRLSNDPVPPAPTQKELEKSGAQAASILTRGRKPGYVEKARLRRWSGQIAVAVRVDDAGLPTYPRIVQGWYEVATVLDTCEYIRALTFTPAQREGRPIASLWDLTVNYRLK
jgi:hypothetical protein